jgi:hypothetical protein
MADPTQTLGSTTQGQPLQQVGNPAKSKTAFQLKWQDNWLRRLRSPPEPAYRQCVARLQRGETAHGVAIWLP